MLGMHEARAGRNTAAPAAPTGCTSENLNYTRSDHSSAALAMARLPHARMQCTGAFLEARESVPRAHSRDVKRDVRVVQYTCPRSDNGYTTPTCTETWSKLLLYKDEGGVKGAARCANVAEEYVRVSHNARRRPCCGCSFV